MENKDNTEYKIQSVFSKVVKAGKRRTYFFDVRTTRSNDYFLTITESRKRMNGDGYDKNKVFLYKEDFNKFIAGMEETVKHVKEELLVDYDFSSFDNREREYHASDSDASIKNETPVNDDSVTDASVGINYGGEADEKLDRSDTNSDNLKSGKQDDDTSSSGTNAFQEDGEKW